MSRRGGAKLVGGHIISYLALFVALGGISYAGTERAATSFSSSGKW